MVRHTSLVLFCLSALFTHFANGQFCISSDLPTDGDNFKTQFVKRVDGDGRLGDDGLYDTDFRWGYVCGRDDATGWQVTFSDIPPSNVVIPGVNPECNDLSKAIELGLEFKLVKQVNPGPTVCSSSGGITFVPYELLFKGDLRPYVNRQYPCTYSPVLHVACSINENPQRGMLKMTHGAADVATTIEDINAAPIWQNELSPIELPDGSSKGTWLVIPRFSSLSASEDNDIWGSDNWKIVFRPGSGWEDLIEFADTVEPNYDLPYNADGDATWLPGIKLNEAFDSKRYCEDQNDESLCVLHVLLIAGDEAGEKRSETTLTVHVIAEDIRPPTFVSSEKNTVIHEDEENQRAKLPKFTAKDGDEALNCPIAYDLSQSTADVASRFSIDNTGQIAFQSNTDQLRWNSNGTNQIRLDVRAVEVESAGKPKCGRVIPTSTVFTTTIEITSDRSVPITVTVDPVDLRVVRYSSDAVDVIGTIAVRRYNSPVDDIQFEILAGSSSQFTIENGIIKKPAGEVIQVAGSLLKVAIKDAKARPLDNVELTIIGTGSIAFRQQSYERHVYASLSGTAAQMLLDLSTELVFCHNCECGVEVDDPSNSPALIEYVEEAGSKSLQTLLEDTILFPLGNYKTSARIWCQNGAESPHRAYATLMVHWHPRPVFANVPAILVEESRDHTVNPIIAKLRPDNRFPYALRYDLVAGSGAPVEIGLDGTVRLTGPLEHATDPEFTLNVEIYEQPKRDNLIARLSIDMVVDENFRPAHFVSVTETVEARCGDDATRIDIDAGSEELTDDQIGPVDLDLANCITIIHFLSDGYVTVQENKAGQCGPEFKVPIAITTGRTTDLLIVHFVAESGCTVVPPPVLPSFDHLTYTETVYFSTALPITIQSEVKTCTACACAKRDDGTQPHFDTLSVNAQTGITTVTSFPETTDFVAGSYTTQIDIWCQSTTSPVPAVTTVIVHWHPLPDFSEPLPVRALDGAKADTKLLTVLPLNGFPYPLTYTVESTVISVGENNGEIRLARDISHKEPPSNPIMVRVFENGREPSAVQVPVSVFVVSNTHPHFYGLDEEPVQCDGNGKVLSVDFGSETITVENFSVLGGMDRCIATPELNGNRLTVKESTTACGLTFTVTILLATPASRDVATLVFHGCTDLPRPSFSEALYETDVFVRDPQAPVQLTETQIRTCPDCQCRLVPGPSPHSSLIGINTVSGIVTITGFPAVIAPGQFDTQVELICKGTANHEAHATLLAKWHPLPTFDAVSEEILALPVSAGFSVVRIRPTGSFPYPLKYETEAGTIVTVNEDTGSISIIRDLTVADAIRHTILIRAFEVAVPLTNKVTVTVPISVITTGTDAFMPAKFVERNPNEEVSCGSGGVGLEIDFRSDNPGSVEVAAIGEHAHCVEIGRSNGLVTVEDDETAACPDFDVTIVLTGERARDFLILSFAGCAEVPSPVPPSFDETAYTETVYFSTALPIVIQSDVKTCTACTCAKRDDGTQPHFDALSVNSQTGIATVTRFPETTDFVAGSYTTQVDIWCQSTTSPVPAVTTITVHWHPLPVFSEPLPLRALDGDTANTKLLTVLPLNGFPYLLTYTVESTVINVGENNGEISLARDISHKEPPSSPIELRTFENGLEPSAVRVPISIFVVSNTKAHFYGLDEEPVQCDGNGKVLSVDFGSDHEVGTIENFSVLGGMGRCLATFELIGSRLTVRESTVACGLTFTVTILLVTPASRDIATLTFQGCTDTPRPSFGQALYETDIFVRNPQAPVQLTETEIRTCPDCQCRIVPGPSPHSPLIGINAVSGIVTITGFPAVIAPGQFNSQVGLICKGIAEDDAHASLLVRWHPLPIFEPIATAALPLPVLANFIVTKIRPSGAFPYPLKYETDADTIVTVEGNTGLVSIARDLTDADVDEHTIQIRASDASDLTPQTVAVAVNIMVMSLGTDAFIPVKFETRNPNDKVPCGEVGTQLRIHLGSDPAERLRAMASGPNAQCAEVDMLPDGSVAVKGKTEPTCPDFTVTIILTDSRSRDFLDLSFDQCAVVPPPVPPSFDEASHMEAVYFSTALPITIQSEVKTCTACLCAKRVDGTQPHFDTLSVNSQTGIATVTRFPETTDFVAGSYTTQVDIWCQSTTSPVPAVTTVTIHWHPLPVFAEPFPVQCLDGDKADTKLLNLLPLRGFPYPLMYTVESTVIKVGENNGKISLVRDISHKDPPVNPSVVRAFENGREPSAVQVPVSVFVVSNTHPHFYGLDEEPVQCDGNGKVLSVDFGSETITVENFSVLGGMDRCIATPELNGNRLTVKESTTACGLTFTVTILLATPASRDVATLVFQDCTDFPMPSFSQALYETDIFVRNPQAPVQLTDTQICTCPDCKCRILPSPSPHSSFIGINEDSGIVTVTGFPPSFEPGQFSTQVELVCESSANKAAYASLVVSWHPNPTFRNGQSEFVSLATPAESQLTTMHPENLFPYELVYETNANSIVRVDASTGRVSLARQLVPTDIKEHTIEIRAFDELDPVERKFPVMLKVTVLSGESGAFLPAKFVELAPGEENVACGDTGTRLAVELRSDTIDTVAVTAEGENVRCVEVGQVSGGFITVKEKQDETCPNFDVTIVLTGLVARDFVTLSFHSCTDTPRPSFSEALYQTDIFVRNPQAPAQLTETQIRTCPDCQCRTVPGPSPHSSLIGINTVSGIVTITGFPAVIAPGQFDTQVELICKGTANHEAHATLLVKWHPLPTFDLVPEQILVLPISAGISVTTVRPARAFPYPLKYETDTGTIIAVNENTGLISMARDLNPVDAIRHTVQVRVFEVAVPPTNKVSVPISIFVTTAGSDTFIPAKFSALTPADGNVLCTGEGTVTGKRLEIELGSDEISAVTVAASGVNARCVEVSQVVSNFVTIRENKIAACPNFIVTVVLMGSRARDFVVLSFSGCGGAKPGDPNNLFDPLDLALYQDNFNNDVAEYFDYNQADKELQIKTIPPPDKSFDLKFGPRSPSQRSGARLSTRATSPDYVLKLRTMEWTVASPIPEIQTPAAIAAIVVGAVLLLAIIAIIILFVKLRRVSRRKPDSITPETDLGFNRSYGEQNRMVTTKAAHSVAGSVKSQIMSLGTESFIDTLRPRAASAREYQSSADDMLMLVDPVSTSSSQTDVDLIEPSFREPFTDAHDERYPMVQVEEPDPDYPLEQGKPTSPPEEVTMTPAPPPPPPPPMFTPLSSTPSMEGSRFFSSGEPRSYEAFATPTPSAGKRFMDELKKAVADPYIVLKPLDSNASVAETPEKKVQFNADVEIITNASSPAQSLGRSSVNPVSEQNPENLAKSGQDAISPPPPVYSASLQQNLAKDASKDVKSPPVPVYLSSPKEPTQVAGITSPSPPAYKSPKLIEGTKSPSEPNVADDSVIISNRQGDKQNTLVPPPPPPPSTEGIFRNPEEANGNDEDARTEL